VEVEDDPELHFARVIERSGHSVVRVYLEPQVEPVEFFEELVELGVAFSASNEPHVFALDVPECADITDVLDILSDDRCDWAPDRFISAVHGAQLRDAIGPGKLPDWVPRDRQ